MYVEHKVNRVIQGDHHSYERGDMTSHGISMRGNIREGVTDRKILSSVLKKINMNLKFSFVKSLEI